MSTHWQAKKTPRAVTSSDRAESVCVPKPSKPGDPQVLAFPRDRRNISKVIACPKPTA
jgi:hypothetical protein